MMPDLSSAVHNSVSMPTYKPTIQTFLSLLQDTFSDSVRFNALTGKAEQLSGGKWVAWKDADDSAVRLYFQSTYGLSHRANLDDAFRVFLRTRTVDPLTEMLDRLEWDGESRITNCLHRLTGCEDTPYSREVSRLIFAGGIHRAYQPGCKFDDVPVLVGRQGGGKSALVRTLAMQDEFFKEVKTFEGREGIEALNGGWIIEIPEMLATARAKEVELVKAYITRQVDSARAAYAKYVEDLPRRCIFIGTTNNPNFLADKTGNRRFYPIVCKLSGYEFFDHIEEHKAYVRQCWAEAKVLYERGDLKPYASMDLLAEIREQQESAEEDDPREGLIRAYCELLPVGAKVCVLELWTRALRQDASIRMPTRSDSRDICSIMSKLPGWEKMDKAFRHPDFGVQKGFQKLFQEVERPPDCPF